MSGVLLSVVVVTTGAFDRRASLTSLVEMMQTMPVEDVEVIIVDQSGIIGRDWGRSTERTPIILETLERGASASRNVGAAVANGQFILWVDDDISMTHSDFVSVMRLADRGEHDFYALGVSGPDESADAAVAKLRGIPDGVSLRRDDALTGVIECGLLVRRSVALEHTFDPEVGVGSGSIFGADEGPDLLLRLLDARKSCVSAHSVTVIHPADVMDLSDPRSYARTLLYSCGRGGLVAKHRLYSLAAVRYFARAVAGLLLMLLRLDARRATVYLLKLTGYFAGYVVGLVLRRRVG